MNLMMHLRSALSLWNKKSELSLIKRQQCLLLLLVGSLMNFSSTSRSFKVSRFVALKLETFKN